MRPYYSHSSRENATPSSGKSLLASCKEVPPGLNAPLPLPPPPLGGYEQLCACVYDKKISLLFVAFYVIIYYFFTICFVGRCNYSLVIKYETAEDSSGRDLISLQQEIQSMQHTCYA